MRNVSGYVCIAQMEALYSFELLFGKKTSNGQLPYDTFETNNLTPYDKFREAVDARQYILQTREAVSVAPARIKMRISQAQVELPTLQKEKSLVVVMLVGEDKQLFGPCVEGRRNAHPLPGASIGDNGFKTFNSLGEAEKLGRAITRQVQVPVQIATFNLEKLVRHTLNKKGADARI